MSDLSTYLAGEIVDWFSQGTQMPTPPDPVYVTLFDDTGTELNGDLQNGRVSVAAGTGWNETETGGAFENAAEIDFGDATVDITIQEVALYDSGTAGSNNELARYTIDGAPQSVSTGTRVFFPAGDVDFDPLDRTE